MPYESIEDTGSGFYFDEGEVEFVSDSEYFEYLESLKNDN